jgi:hypothetical protein
MFETVRISCVLASAAPTNIVCLLAA